MGCKLDCAVVGFWFDSFSFSPSQAGDLKISRSSSLDKLEWNRRGGRALVKMSANWCDDEIGKRCMRPASNFLRTIWQSISKCFVLSWKTGLAAMCSALWLSQ